MKQFTDTLQPEAIIQVDYNSPALPEAVKKYKPKVFKEGKEFCCCYGPDPQAGIFCCGFSPKEAMKSWNKAYLKEGIKFFTTWRDGEV